MEVYQINPSLVKQNKTFGQVCRGTSIVRKIRAMLLHTDCKSVCRDERALHTDRRIRFRHFGQPGLEVGGIVAPPGKELMQAKLEHLDFSDPVG